jgi:hypothetical protein
VYYHIDVLKNVISRYWAIIILHLYPKESVVSVWFSANKYLTLLLLNKELTIHIYYTSMNSSIEKGLMLLGALIVVTAFVSSFMFNVLSVKSGIMYSAIFSVPTISLFVNRSKSSR